ncbi:cytochrome P450 [Streptomyces sp. NPDC007084]|uniref:cytochrome P450 n=1 Tax=Streptomyces sp. NPDC007084 TaxID=3154313 RepID=UPI0034565B71
MAEQTTLLTGRNLPPVRDWGAGDVEGITFDPVLAELMRDGPLARIRLPHGEGWAWLATRYEDVRMIAGDPRFSRAAAVERPVTRPAPHLEPDPGTLAFAEGADHQRLRRTVESALTDSAVERLRPHAQQMLDELVDGLLHDGPPADLVERVLQPFPAAVACEVMGVPSGERRQVQAWVRSIGSADGCADTARRAKDALASLYEWIGTAVRERHGSADTDVLSLLGAAVGRGEISEAEAVGIAGPLQTGGEAVTHTCGQMLFLMLTEPALYERLRARPETRAAAVEELLRHLPHRASVGLARVALEDVDVHGVRISAGEPVYLSYLAANRDPDVFPDPDRLDVGRDAGATLPHLAFGSGPHHCAGAALARTQTELLVDTLLDRLPGLRLAVHVDQVPFRRRAMIRGPRALPVRW